MTITTTDSQLPAALPHHGEVCGKPVTRASFRAEIEAVRGGYSRNVRRDGMGWGKHKDWLELWPRDIATGGIPILIDTDCPPTEAERPAWLARFTFAYDPDRYTPAAPARLRGAARWRSFWEALHGTHVPPVRFRAKFPHRMDRQEEPERSEDEDDADYDDEEAA